MVAKAKFSQDNVRTIFDIFRIALECASTKILVLEEIVEILVKEHLNMKQIEMLLKMEENEGLFYYRLVNKLSEEQGLPESTVRWNLNRLRKANMVITGDKNNKGVPVKLTEKGKMVVLAFKNGKKK
jgi:DNA-binding MarR family transcriptional regulator